MCMCIVLSVYTGIGVFFSESYLVGTEVGSDTMRADLELRNDVILRDDTLREVVPGGGGWEGGEGRGTVSRKAV